MIEFFSPKRDHLSRQLHHATPEVLRKRVDLPYGRQQRNPFVSTPPRVGELDKVSSSPISLRRRYSGYSTSLLNGDLEQDQNLDTTHTDQNIQLGEQLNREEEDVMSSASKKSGPIPNDSQKFVEEIESEYEGFQVKLTELTNNGIRENQNNTGMESDMHFSKSALEVNDSNSVPVNKITQSEGNGATNNSDKSKEGLSVASPTSPDNLHKSISERNLQLPEAIASRSTDSAGSQKLAESDDQHAKKNCSSSSLSPTVSSASSLSQDSQPENELNITVTSPTTLVPQVSQPARSDVKSGGGDLCKLFGVSDTRVFDGEMIMKKLNTDFMFKESFVWINLTTRSIHW